MNREDLISMAHELWALSQVPPREKLEPGFQRIEQFLQEKLPEKISYSKAIFMASQLNDGESILEGVSRIVELLEEK